MPYVPIIARIDSLPPLPESVIRLEKLYAEGSPEIDDLVKIIESDPSLTADMLAKVNAPLYSFSRQIVSILQAVTLFGSTQIRSMVLSSAMERNFDINLVAYGISTSDFARISQMQSDFIFQWYMSIDVEHAKIMTPIAFLMEMGKILIAKDVLDRKIEVDFLTDLRNYDDVSSVENIHVMMTSAQINAIVFEHWKLNPLFIECMKYLDNEYDIPDNVKRLVKALQIVRCAVNVKEQFSDESIARALVLVEESCYDLEHFERILKRVKSKYLDKSF